MTKKYYAISFGLIGLFSGATAQASCGTTACSINTNWGEHGLSRPGWSGDLRYSYSKADKLRAGSSKISVNPTDPALDLDSEVENLRTINKLVTATLDYTHDEHWGYSLQVPYVMRDHNHSLANPTTPGYQSFTADSVGDIKVTGRYRWTLDETTRTGMGVKFGLKLNTGKKDFVIAQSGLKPSEVTLQPGNGSTDLILGLSWQQTTPGSDWSLFAQGTLQSSVSSSATFRPGNQVNIDGGTRYAINHSLSGLLQLNAQWNSADSGTSAATSAGAASSGGKSVSLSPGLSYTIAPGTQIYGLLQLPLYQYVNGEQLTASHSITVGVNHSF